jgi:hypothetical protein
VQQRPILRGGLSCRVRIAYRRSHIASLQNTGRTAMALVTLKERTK